jgi:hypothetical protein
VGAVKCGVCVHGVVGGLCEEWKCEQSVEVYACMVLSLGCVKSGSGSSRAWCMNGWCCRWWAVCRVEVGAVRRGVCVHSGLCEEWKWEQSGVVLALMMWTKSLSVVYCMLYRDVI